MLDIQLFRENADVIRESEKKRFKDEALVDKVVELDRKWREALKQAEALRHRRNVVSMEIAGLKKAGKHADGKISEMKSVNIRIGENESLANELLAKRDACRYKIGNVLHSDVVTGRGEHENKFIRAWGKPLVLLNDMESFKRDTRGTLAFEPLHFKPRSHVELLEELDLADIERAGSFPARDSII